jgi:hypothetical protein
MTKICHVCGHEQIDAAPGYVLLPEEPTHAMLLAGLKWVKRINMLAGAYHAMIAAAKKEETDSGTPGGFYDPATHVPSESDPPFALPTALKFDAQGNVTHASTIAMVKKEET